MMKQPLSLRNTQRISFRSSFSVSPQVSNTTLYLNSLIITPPESMLMALILYSKSQVCQTVLLPGFCLTSPLPLARKWPKTAFNSRENTLNVAFSTPPGYKDCLWVIFDPAVKITVTQSQLQTTHTHTHTHTHTSHTQCWLISDRTKTLPVQVYRHLSTTPYTAFKDQSSNSFTHNHQGPVS